jgi:hypothetical protein
VAIRDRLEQWGRLYNLDEEWIYDIALDTMMWWMTRPSWPNRWHNNHTWGINAIDAPPQLKIQEEWRFERWDQFNKRVLDQIAAFRREVCAYQALHLFDPEAIGNSPYHFDWLALFQVETRSPDKIRDWHDPNGKLDESAITKGYTRFARRIGLRLRTKYPRR